MADDQFYSDDVTAAAKADDNQNPDNWKEKEEEPVTSGDQTYGNLDDDPHSKDGTIYDEDGDPSEDESQFETPD
jgi:hypothetical protein